MLAPNPESRARPASEPFLNVPWIVLLLIAVLIGAHAARVGLRIDAAPFCLTSEDLNAGRWMGLVSYMFVHQNWAHVIMNSVFILAFGAPVARYLGEDARGVLLFLAFFLLCGALAGLAFGGLELGLAAARLIEGRGRLGSMTGRTVVGMTIGWILVNAVLGLTGLTPGSAGAPVAWEAHIFGYLAGLLLIGIVGRLAGVDDERAFTKT